MAHVRQVIALAVACLIVVLGLRWLQSSPGSVSTAVAKPSTDSAPKEVAEQVNMIAPPPEESPAIAKSAITPEGAALADSRPALDPRTERHKNEIDALLKELDKSPTYGNALALAHVSVASVMDAQGRFIDASHGPVQYSNKGFDGSVSVGGRVYQITYAEFPALGELNAVLDEVEEKRATADPRSPGARQTNLHTFALSEDTLREVKELAMVASASLRGQ